MKDLPLLAIRVIAGGAIVAAIAVLGDTLKPKMFAGLLAGAPSVATVSLVATGLAMGAAKDADLARGMIAGATGLVVYSVVASILVKHLNAFIGSALAWIAWAVPAGTAYVILSR